MGSKEKSLHIEFGMSIGFAGIELISAMSWIIDEPPGRKILKKS